MSSTPSTGDGWRTLVRAVKSALTVETLLSRLWGEEAPARGLAFCPFHDHRRNTPSFHIQHHGEWWHCYSCQRKGDVIAFVRETQLRQGLPDPGFKGALEAAAEMAGVATGSAKALLMAMRAPRRESKRTDEAVRRTGRELMIEPLKRCRSLGEDGAQVALFLTERLEDLEGRGGTADGFLSACRALAEFGTRFAFARENVLSGDFGMTEIPGEQLDNLPQ